MKRERISITITDEARAMGKAIARTTGSSTSGSIERLFRSEYKKMVKAGEIDPEALFQTSIFD